MVAGIFGWRRLLCKIVVFLLKTVMLAGWEFALRMIPARFRVLLQSVLSQVLNRGEAASRSALRLFSSPHPVMSKTAVHLLDRILRPHGRAPCTMPSNPGHVIVLQDNAVTSMTKHTYLALYELFGGVINQACINYVTSILCSYAATWRTRIPEG